MAKLFLIRRGLDVFLGPMSLQELKQSYSKMAFGMQDEVSGHLGPWVVLEKIELLKKFYPDVAMTVHQELASSWGGHDQITKVVRTNGMTPRPKSPKSRTGTFAVGIFLMAAVAASVAFYMARTAKLNGKLFFEESESASSPVANAWNAGETEFTQYMEKQLPSLLPKVLRSKNAMQNWLPYLRAYAFIGNGEIEGLAPNVLRGSILNPPSSLPNECTLKYWQRRWANGADSFIQIASIKPLPKGHWANFLQWDPYWIRRRKMAGWLRPRNYYEACLTMAAKSFAEVYGPQAQVVAAPQGVNSEDWRIALNAIDRRMNVLKAVIGARNVTDIESFAKGFYSSSKEVPHDALSLMSCFEIAPDLSGLEICQAAVREWKEPLGSYFDWRYRANAMRILLGEGGRFDAQKEWDMVFSGDVFLSDATTGFEYKPEWSFVRSLRKFSSLNESTYSQLSSQFPDVNFRDFVPSRAP